MLFPYFPIGERFRFLHEARDGLSAVLKVRRESSLEPEGFTVTIHGKGTYVAAANKEMMMDEYHMLFLQSVR